MMKRARKLLWLVPVLLLAPGLAVAQEDAASRAAQGYLPQASRGEAFVWTDRSDLEAQVLARWANIPTRTGHASDPDDLAKAVRSVPEARLIRAAAARDVDTFIRRLAGVPSGRLANGEGFVTNSGGTPIADTTFVATTPCRIFDTRLATAGKMIANETRSFYTNEVSAGATNWANQGGDASNCPEVPFDPPAVLITLTVTDPEGIGNARLWAFLGAEPLASNINFRTGVNIANTTSTPTCPGCGADINVKVTQRVHVLADIVGYFRAKDKTLDLQVMNTPNTGTVGIGTSMGLLFPDGVNTVFRTTMFLPEDFSSQTDLTARFLFSTASTGCAVTWATNSPLRVLRPGLGTATDLTVTPLNEDLAVPATAGNIFQTARVLSATNIVAGDLLTLSWFRSGGSAGDTCAGDLIVRGVQLLYE